MRQLIRTWIKVKKMWLAPSVIACWIQGFDQAVKTSSMWRGRKKDIAWLLGSFFKHQVGRFVIRAWFIGCTEIKMELISFSWSPKKGCAKSVRQFSFPASNLYSVYIIIQRFLSRKFTLRLLPRMVPTAGGQTRCRTAFSLWYIGLFPATTLMTIGALSTAWLSHKYVSFWR